MEKNNGAFRIQLLVLIAGLAIMGVKFTAYFLTHSNSIFTDALESIINILAGGVSLYSIWLSAHPKDKNHPYGHGKVEFLAGGFEGGLIFLAGWVAIVKSLVSLFERRALDHLDWGMGIVLASGFLNYILGHILVFHGKQKQSIPLVSDGEHLKSDAYTSLGILLGITALYFGAPYWVDSVVAILFGAYITYSGFKIFRSSLSGIMDEANPLILNDISETLEKRRNAAWIDVHNLRVIQFGGLWHVDAHVTLPFYLSLQDAHMEVDRIEEAIKDSHASVGELFLHADPCIPSSCGICEISSCTHRSKAFEKRIVWQVDHLISNQKHHIGL